MTVGESFVLATSGLVVAEKGRNEPAREAAIPRRIRTIGLDGLLPLHSSLRLSSHCLPVMPHVWEPPVCTSTHLTDPPLVLASQSSGSSKKTGYLQSRALTACNRHGLHRCSSAGVSSIVSELAWGNFSDHCSSFDRPVSCVGGVKRWATTCFCHEPSPLSSGRSATPLCLAHKM